MTRKEAKKLNKEINNLQRKLEKSLNTLENTVTLQADNISNGFGELLSLLDDVIEQESKNNA